MNLRATINRMAQLLVVAVGYLRNVNRAVEFVLRPVAVLLIVTMLGSVVWGVLSRLLGISSPWTDSVMLIMLPALAFVVAPPAYRRSANVALDLLGDSLSPRARGVHGLALHLAILLLLLVGLDLTLRKVGIDPGALSGLIRAVCGLDLSEIRPFALPMRVPVLGIRWSSVYTVMPICIALMILANVELLLRQLLSLLEPGERRVPPIRDFEESASRLWE